MSSFKPKHHFPQKPKQVCIGTYEEELERKRNNKKRIREKNTEKEKNVSGITVKEDEWGRLSIIWDPVKI